MISLSLVLSGTIAWRSWNRYQSLKLEQKWVRDNPRLPRTVPDQEMLAPLSLALNHAPGNDRVHFLKASSYESAASGRGFLQLFKKAEMLALAEQELSQAILLRPAEARYWAALGRIEMARRRGDLAERAFQHAVRLAPADGLIHRDYGIALLVTGKPQPAAAQFAIARNFAAGLPLIELLEALGSGTGDPQVWQSIVRYHPADLKVFASFLDAHGQGAMAAQYRLEAAQLEKAKTP